MTIGSLRGRGAVVVVVVRRLGTEAADREAEVEEEEVGEVRRPRSRSATVAAPCREGAAARTPSLVIRTGAVGAVGEEVTTTWTETGTTLLAAAAAEAAEGPVGRATIRRGTIGAARTAARAAEAEAAVVATGERTGAAVRRRACWTGSAAAAAAGVRVAARRRFMAGVRAEAGQAEVRPIAAGTCDAARRPRPLVSVA